ncbi:hypothetical protein QPL51_04540 [Escherichia coli]|uniref:hypothetical protein n=1 Tax=Escherichia coli TaxID=562 RepID=UPI00287AF30A|nr:hypothetical protein [Escherichia coli]MDS1552305.1 hypothetical protein [Escherichia coli]
MRNYTKFIRSLHAMETNKEILTACRLAGLEIVGAGSSRIVFALNDRLVIKVANSDAGVDQNETECKVWNFLDYDRPHLKQYFAKVHMHLCDPDNLFIVMDRLSIASKGSAKHITACNELKYNAKRKTIERQHHFADALQHVDDTLSTLTIIDISKTNIGQDRNGLIKVLDYGLTRNIWNQYYKKRDVKTVTITR